MDNSVQVKEEHGSLKLFLIALKYEEHNWEVIGDFEMGLSWWVSKATLPSFHVIFIIGTVVLSRILPKRTEFSVESNIVKWERLLDLRKYYFLLYT